MLLLSIISAQLRCSDSLSLSPAVAVIVPRLSTASATDHHSRDQDCELYPNHHFTCDGIDETFILEQTLVIIATSWSLWSFWLFWSTFVIAITATILSSSPGHHWWLPSLATKGIHQVVHNLVSYKMYYNVSHMYYNVLNNIVDTIHHNVK